MDLWKKVKRAGNTRRKIIKGREEILRRGFELGEQLLRNSRIHAHRCAADRTARAPVVLESVNDHQPSTSSATVSECIDIGSNEPPGSIDLGVCFVLSCQMRMLISHVLYN